MFMEYIGRFSLGNKVMVSDPCYCINALDQGVLENVREGFWDAYIKTSDEGEGGMHVSELVAINLDYNSEYNELNSEDINERQLFVVGVDSDAAGIFDYDYYCKYHYETNIDEEWYNNQVVDQFFSPLAPMEWKKSIFTEFNGVASTTGYGNGNYVCYVARNTEGEIIGIKIVYISDEFKDE